MTKQRPDSGGLTTDDRTSVGGLRRLLALLMVLLLLAAACGGGDDASDEENDGSAPAEEASEIDPDGVIRYAYDLTATARGGFTWDPAAVTTQLTDSGLFYLVYGALLRPEASGELVPDLAEEVTITDANTIDITLREGLTFSDGTPFDADAVKAGIERNLAVTDSVGFGTAFFDLKTITVNSPTTLTLSIPNGTAASWHDTFLGSWEVSIVKPGTDFSKPVGAGPMVVSTFRPEQSIVLEKNPAYWDADSVLLGGLELVQALDAKVGVTALGAGQVDLANLDPGTLPSLRGEHESLIAPNPNTLMTLMVCKREAPLSDAKVRLALNKAIDREAINEAAFGGAYEPAFGLWPEDHRFHNPDVSESIAFDPDGAKELLAEAGYEDGFEFDIHVIQGGGMPEVTEIMQQQFADIGVTANLVPALNYVEDFLVAKKSGTGAVPTMSPNRLKLLQWSGNSIGNTCGYDDPELTALEAELAAVSDASDEAVEIWHQIEEKVVAQDALSVFIMFGATVAGYDPEVVGDLAIMPFTLYVPDVRTTYVKAR